MVPHDQRSVHACDEAPDPPQLEDAVKEAFTALVLDTRVPDHARERALGWLKAKIRQEDAAPSSDMRSSLPR